MLKIRASQMKAFSDLRCDRFIAETLETIQGKYPLHYRQMGRDEVQALILRGIKRGEELEIQNFVLLGSLIELTVAFGENFEHSQRSVWANEVLNDPSLPPAFKVRIIEERLFADTKGRPMIVV